MRNILIINSHYPPSNLTGVHRSRNYAKFLPQFGWNPVVLTIDPKDHEENLDFDLNKLLPSNQQIELVRAFRITKPRVIGDLGLRAFIHLSKRAEEIIKTKKIDFVYIFIPSFYLSLLGPLLYRRFKINYGIDYIDPWVHFFPGSENLFSRHWLSTQLAKLLEPFVVKNASLISSVSSGYIEPIFQRNPDLQKKTKSLSIPYGWDSDEQYAVDRIERVTTLFHPSSKLQLVYTGAFLPKSVEVLENLCKIIKANIDLFEDVEIHFIGTGLPASSNRRPTITEIASRFNLSGTILFEHPERISYVDVLHHIKQSDGLFILGSTESHYSPSKLFNAFVMKKPIFAILHPESSAIAIIENTKWGSVCSYTPDENTTFSLFFIESFRKWKHNTLANKWEFDHEYASNYNASTITAKLSEVLNDLV